MNTRAATMEREMLPATAGARTSGTAERLLAEARHLAEPAHRAAVEALPPAIRHVAGYHAGWWDADGRPADGAGKALRPALTLASARAAGGDPDPDAATDLRALAVLITRRDH
jgi:geranylgeranyl diphosphate synthase, type I